jgi:hypothetical protein
MISALPQKHLRQAALLEMGKVDAMLGNRQTGATIMQIKQEIDASVTCDGNRIIGRIELLERRIAEAIARAPEGVAPISLAEPMEPHDIVLTQEHSAEMARIESRKAIALALIPGASMAVASLVTLVIGCGVGYMIGVM